MIEFVERVGAEPKVFNGVGMTAMEDKPEDKKKEQHKKDDDGDAAIDQAQEQQEDGANEKNIQH